MRMTCERRKHALAHNRMRGRARYHSTSVVSTMLPLSGDFAVPHKSSLAKSLISLNPFINIMCIIGHSPCQMPENADLTPPAKTFGGVQLPMT